MLVSLVPQGRHIIVSIREPSAGDALGSKRIKETPMFLNLRERLKSSIPSPASESRYFLLHPKESIGKDLTRVT